jgi:hypothetical protein
MTTLNEKLSNIQTQLKVGKPRFNKFGGYHFRSTEDIMEGVKPLLKGLTLTINESMEVLGEMEFARFYKKVVASISDGKDVINSVSYTREDEGQKGMTQAQLSGSVSSYGAKMALRGLFLLDDTPDDDTLNTHGKEDKPQTSGLKNKAKGATVTKEVKSDVPEEKSEVNETAPQTRRTSFRRNK